MGKKRPENTIIEKLWNDSVEYEQWVVRLRLQRIANKYEGHRYEGVYTTCKCHRVTPLGFQRWTEIGWMGCDSVLPCDLKYGEDPKEAEMKKLIEKREEEKDIRCHCHVCEKLWRT